MSIENPTLNPYDHLIVACEALLKGRGLDHLPARTILADWLSQSKCAGAFFFSRTSGRHQRIQLVWEDGLNEAEYAALAATWIEHCASTYPEAIEFQVRKKCAHPSSGDQELYKILGL